MRIMYVLATSLGIGGAEKQALAVADRMEKRGHAVALLVLMPRVPEEWPTTIDTTYLGIRKTPLSLLTGLVHGTVFCAIFGRTWSTATVFTPTFSLVCSGYVIRASWLFPPFTTCMKEAGCACFGLPAHRFAEPRTVAVADGCQRFVV